MHNLGLTYNTSYDLFIVNYFFYDILKDLSIYNKDSKIIFIDDYYDIKHLQNAFMIGDDYMVNPLVIDELQIKANYYYKKIFKSRKAIIHFDTFFYHKQKKQLFLGDTLIKLSPNELKLVDIFVMYLKQPIQKDTLYEIIDNYSDGTLRVYISKLKKIGLNMKYTRSNNSYTLC